MYWLHFLFSFKGRINRAKYWAFVGIVFVATIVAFLLLGFTVMELFPHAPRPDAVYVGIGLVVVIYLVVLALIAIPVSVKRLHDRNKSWWWILPLVIAPISLREAGELMRVSSVDAIAFVGTNFLVVSVLLSIWALIELGFLKGTDGPNRYGSDPRKGPIGDVAKVFE